MPTLPWTTAKNPTQPAPAAAAAAGTAASGPVLDDAVLDGAVLDGTVQVMASRFVLTSARHTAAMLSHALRIRRAMLRAPGAVGVSLIARPLRREYWTLSAWADQAALDAFVATPQHREAMRRLGPAMAESAFAFWTAPSDGPAPSWKEARERVAAAPVRRGRRQD